MFKFAKAFAPHGFIQGLKPDEFKDLLNENIRIVESAATGPVRMYSGDASQFDSSQSAENVEAAIDPFLEEYREEIIDLCCTNEFF